MKSLIVISAVCGVAAFGCSTKQDTSDSTHTAIKATAAVTAADAACQPPATAANTPEESAWRLFVAAVCPVNSDKYPYVVWENWIEQNQLYNPGPSALVAGQHPRLHGSPLREFLRAQAAAGRNRLRTLTIDKFLLDAAQDCGKARASNRIICEETRINPEAQGFIGTNKLITLKGQVTFAAAGKPFQFPGPAVEIKVDWVQLQSCNAPPADVHIEKVNDACYALAGMHLISKLIDKWIWATFEPQNPITNPLRCHALGCKDSWGSNPATTSGTATQLTASLSALMTSAKVAPEWHNYRLDGVQTDFTDGANPSRLGNSIIEGENVGGPMQKSSCITCHQFSTIRTDGLAPMEPSFTIGNPLPLPAGMISRDFVWSFLVAH
jgi:hypothetical protein